MADVKLLHCIRNQNSVPLGVVGEALAASDVPWRYVDPWRGDDLPDLTETSGLIVLGGAMNADQVEEFPWLADTRTLMREAVEAERPLLGVCLGAQLLARSVGAAVTPAREREIGFRKVEVLPAGERDPLLSAFAPSALVFQFHEDECALPADAELLATNDDVRVQAFRVGERAYGVQFHFEVTTRQITDWSDETTPELLRDVWGTTKETLLAEAEAHLEAQQQAGKRLTAAFVDLLS